MLFQRNNNDNDDTKRHKGTKYIVQFRKIATEAETRLCQGCISVYANLYCTYIDITLFSY